jgi:hypothetical protein
MARETTEGISVRKISTKINQPAFEEAANNLAIPGLLEGTMGREVVTRHATGPLLRRRQPKEGDLAYLQVPRRDRTGPPRLSR